MDISFEAVVVGDGLAVASFLAGDTWPYHSSSRYDGAAVARGVDAGEYFNESVRTHWIKDAGERCGMVRIFDLEDSTPMFDLRIATSHRARGIGRTSVGWLTAYVFNSRPSATRIEGVTRADNLAMRSVFRACGYVKEAVYREAWPAHDGALRDAIGYAILRHDWEDGTTSPVAWHDE
jgi:RimJ/RimL family protein N-acetyltransferase